MAARPTSTATETTTLRPSKVLQPSEDGPQSQASPSFSRVRTEVRRRRWVLGLNYLLVSGVCATTIVSTASQLSVLAEHCGRDTEPGAVFITRGVGSILGAIVSARLYKALDGNRVLLLMCLAAAVTLLGTPFVTAVWGLHAVFGVVGFTSAVMDTGCQLLTCTVHGERAGVWLGSNGVSFSVFASLVPLVAWMTADLVVQFSVSAAVAVVACVFLFLAGTVDIVHCTKRAGDMEEPSAAREGSPSPSSRQEDLGVVWTYRMELMASFMVFLLIGGKQTVTAYLEQYLNDVGVLPPSSASLLLVVLYSTVTMSRVLGTVDQKFFDTGGLYTHLSALLLLGSGACLMIALLPDSGTALYVGLALYGFSSGPTPSFTYDLVNRLTPGGASETGMSIVMFGIMVGASLLPYLTSLLWVTRLGPSSLPAVLLASMLLPLPLLLATHTVREPSREGVRGGGGYTPVAGSSEDEEEEEEEEETKEPPLRGRDEEEGAGRRRAGRRRGRGGKDASAAVAVVS